MLILYFELCFELTDRGQKFKTKSYARPVVVTVTVTRVSWNAVKNKDSVILSLYTVEEN
jgi:hypothetical protein